MSDADDELICAELLRWEQDARDEEGAKLWRDSHGERVWVTPDFTQWAYAGMIIDAMAQHGVRVEMEHGGFEDGSRRSWIKLRHFGEGWTSKVRSAPISLPQAIRTAALDMIRRPVQPGESL
jgi:hypothetical protein